MKLRSPYDRMVKETTAKLVETYLAKPRGTFSLWNMSLLLFKACIFFFFFSSPVVNSGPEYSLSCCTASACALHCVKTASQQGDDKLMAKDNAHKSLWHKRASSLVPQSHTVTISMFRLYSLTISCSKSYVKMLPVTCKIH